jgi:hypothetical protein
MWYALIAKDDVVDEALLSFANASVAGDAFLAKLEHLRAAAAGLDGSQRKLMIMPSARAVPHLLFARRIHLFGAYRRPRLARRKGAKTATIVADMPA